MSANKPNLSQEDKWQIDQTIMSWWDAEGAKNKKNIELQCYKLFKSFNFNDEFLSYLRENDAEKLAEEMEHFSEVYHKVPHEHETRKAA